MKNFKYYLPFTLSALIFLFIVGFSNNDRVDSPIYRERNDTAFINLSADKLTEKSLKKELHKLKVKHVDIVFAQAKLETGNFKSDVYKQYSNLFGFRLNNDYMKFTSWRECCKYYKDWQSRKYKDGDYYEFLINIGYAEDTTYIKKLKLCLK